MIDGFFRIAFTGAAASGFGMLVFSDGNLAGADVGGATYDGTYAQNSITGEINLKVTMSAPSGVTPVQTGVPLAEAVSVPITATLAEADLTSEKPILLETPLGPVNIVFRKIRDLRLSLPSDRSPL
jgi:hypothetical protein